MATVIAYPGCLLRPQFERDRARHRHPICHLTHHCADWVKLFQSPDGQTPKIAKLLCQESLATWIAWVPSHGEVVLDRSQFYC